MTTNETNQIVRWLVIIVLGIATAGMAAVSLRANYLFGYGFGQTPEKAQVFGWANVAADLWKVSGLIVITSLWRANQKRFALSLMPIWALCLLWGLVGAVGVYAQDRTALIGGREAVAATYKDAEREAEEIEAKLKGLTSQRSVSQVEAAIAAVLARPVISGERVRGTVGKLSFGFPLVFAFLIEIVSAFGPAGIVAYAEATRRNRGGTTEPDMARSGELLPAPASEGELGRVVEWMADRTEPTGDTSAITIGELHADYEVWCLGKGLRATALGPFASEFDRVREVPQLSGKIRKFGNRYYGIRLVHSNIARLPTRKGST